MTTAPDQPPVSTVATPPKTPSVTSPASPSQGGPPPPAPPPPTPNVPSTPTPPPAPPATPTPTSSPPPPINPPGGTQDKPPATVSTTPPHKKFPFMMVTFFITVVLAGLSGSFLFFQYTSANNPVKTPAKILITPPVTIAPTATTAPANPFESSSQNLTTNPFASPTAMVNPFGTYQNPFQGATISATPKPVVNPF